MPSLFSAARKEPRVECTQELIRIMRLPRRTRTEEESEALAKEFTELYRIPGGTMELRSVQAESLLELGTTGGAFCPQTVGAGKTITSILGAVGNAERPLLIVPAKLVSKTERDKRALARHFLLPEFLRVMTYQWLGREQAADALERYAPDLIILDEAHWASNIRGAAVARRLRKYFAKNPQTKCLALGGTMTKRSILDFAHILHWCLKENEPLPNNFNDLSMWADALDERKGQTKRADPGDLEMLCNEEELKVWQFDKRAAARSAFRRRLIETPGVVATEEAECDATLTVRAVEVTFGAELEAAFKDLRQYKMPDGRELWDGLEENRHAREMALGFWYRWDPMPPKEWFVPRKKWGQFVRKILKHSRKYDTELQVRKAYQAGEVEPEENVLGDWLAVRDDFKPKTVATWIDDAALKFAAEWAERERGIVWVEHVEFGTRLEQDFGLPYYGKKGLDARKRFIDDHPPGTPMAASIASNAEGRNLQAWCTNLITSPPPNGKALEQLLGRTHRPGQEADEVEVEVFANCSEHVGSLWQCVADSRFVRDTVGSKQKILLAGLDFPSPDEIVFRSGERWNK